MSAVAASLAAQGEEDRPVLCARGLRVRYGALLACAGVDAEVWPGEVLGVVGESGSGKSTLLRVLAGRQRPDAGRVELQAGARQPVDLYALEEPARRRLSRESLALVHQTPRDGLRMNVSAGANIGEPLMAAGARHYGDIRAAISDWLRRVEIDETRIDEHPAAFSGGMQQRLQIARALVATPRVVLMDEPTGGLDVSVQARLLDLLRKLVGGPRMAVVVVTHDLAVARLLADRLLVMRQGRVVESGLTDRVLDDPQHAYTQLLVSSVLRP